MSAALPTGQLVALRRRCPDALWSRLCEVLAASPSDRPLRGVMDRLPVTTNAEVYAELESLLDALAQRSDWAGLGVAFELVGQAVRHVDEETRAELIWTGPISPGLRRLDQALYDLIHGSQQRILLVTFAASHVSRLNTALLAALGRGVELRLVLEFKESSGGQLSLDALRAFSEPVREQANIYHWPPDRREQNPAGRPGKLHAKCAVVDAQSLVSSANLTDDAFNRNIELGVLSKNSKAADDLWRHFDSLVQRGILKRV